MAACTTSTTFLVVSPALSQPQHEKKKKVALMYPDKCGLVCSNATCLEQIEAMNYNFYCHSIKSQRRLQPYHHITQYTLQDTCMEPTNQFSDCYECWMSQLCTTENSGPALLVFLR